MGELKGRRHDQARRHREDRICRKHSPPGVDEQRDHHGPRDEDRLAGDDARKMPATWRAQGTLSDPSAGERRDVTDRLPPKPHQRVHGPDVVLLKPVPRPRGLRRREPGDRHLGDVVVVAVDVRVRVVRDVVLDAPRIAAEPEERVRRPAEQVVVAPLPEIRAVIRVVLYAERRQQRAHHEAHHADQPGDETRPDEHQHGPRHGREPERDRRLRIEEQSSPDSCAARRKVLLDLAPGLFDEGSAVVERDLRSSCRHEAPPDPAERQGSAWGAAVGTRPVDVHEG